MRDAKTIADRPQTACRAPPQLRQRWQDAVALPAKRLLEARARRDDSAYYRAVFDLLRVPSLTLALPPSADEPLGAVAGDRLAEYVRRAGDVEPPAGRHADGRSEEQRRYGRVRSLLHAGASGKAARALMAEPLVAVTPAVLKTLQALHPAPPAGDLPALPSGTPVLPLQDAQMSRYVRGLPGSVAAGPSGWTYEMVQDACGNDVCRRALLALLYDTAAGLLPRPIAILLLAARLFAAGKPGGGVRPVAAGEAFYRISASFVLHSRGFRAAAREALLPVQLGVAVPGGGCTAAHLLQAAVEDERLERLMIAVDYRNAFNSVSRAAMLTALYAHEGLRDVWRLADMAYARPSPLFCSRPAGWAPAMLWSRTGARQGDPLGSLLFALAAAELFKQLAAAVADSTTVAYIDDGNLAIPPTADGVREVLRIARTQGALVNLELQLDKTRLVWAHASAVPAEVAAVSEETGVVLAEDRCAIVLGAPVSSVPAAVEQQALKVAEAHRPFFQRLLSPELSSQEALHLLRVCAVPKMSHLLRSARPSATAAAARVFDSMVEETALARLGIEGPLAAYARDQLTLPIRMGGLGLARAADTAPAAWYAGQAQAAAHLSRAGLGATVARAAESAAVKGSLVSQCGLAASQHIPTDGTDDVAFYAADDRRAVKLQRTLTRAAQELAFASLLSASPAKEDRARLLAASAPKAGLFLTVLPAQPHLRLNDAEFGLAVRFRVGLPPTDLMPAYCRSCGVRAGDLLLDPWHGLSCHRARSAAITARHDSVVRLLAQWITRLGGSARLEPRPPRDNPVADGGRRRPDLDVTLGASRYLVDVTIRHPCAQSHVAMGGRSRLAVAEQAEKAKSTYHAATTSAARPKAVFVPFVVETFGGVGKQACAFIKQVLRLAGDLAYVWAPKELVYGLPQAVAVAVQRGNAKAVAECLCNAGE